ncbi:cyclopropane fatty acyl phospholipid synthase [Candidatus Woesearchaeota archaeon]|nr:MAG: cyclopropane fatty acyl phospholipid synthase [Candidatus Woesearchaeota archaeon]
MDRFRKTAQELLLRAGVKINGGNSWDIQVNNPDFYRRVLAGGSLALGESYMDGWWDCRNLDEFFTRIFRAELEKKVSTWSLLIPYLKASILNLQSRSRAFHIGKVHYDIGNDLYETMLDKRMTYTCGYWKDAKTLEDAQDAKLDLVCRKIGLKKGDRVLDIGCGWGSFAKYAAEKYGAKVTGITVSKEQAVLARKRCKGLPVTVRLQDYRDVDGQFDHIISLGMFEHVGYKNYRAYMEVAHRCLKDGGLFLLHTIGGNLSVKATDAWIDKYIFPNSLLPSVKQIAASIEGLFVMEDWHNFGADYDRTLMAWFKNFDDGWQNLKSSYDERFYRMWKYYLLACAGTFRARKNQLWQIVLSKKGVAGGYVRIS